MKRVVLFNIIFFMTLYAINFDSCCLVCFSQEVATALSVASLKNTKKPCRICKFVKAKLVSKLLVVGNLFCSTGLHDAACWNVLGWNVIVSGHIGWTSGTSWWTRF